MSYSKLPGPSLAPGVPLPDRVAKCALELGREAHPPAARQLPLPGIGDQTADWSVRRSSRARRLSARVFHSGRVEIVAPLRVSQRRIADFVARHREWIERKSREGRARANTAAAQFPPPQLVLAAFGEHWRLHLAGGKGAPRVVVRDTGLLAITGDPGDPRRLRRAVLDWLTRHAQAHLGARLAGIAAEAGFSYQRLQLRLQRTRWGSCSARGTISLNVCLAFQRPEVVRYLLIHELAHTRHMNHSARFWDCVAQHCPQWRTLDSELLDGWRQVPPWMFP
ncbi:MAG: M48 family metallopeptidase [Sinobacteraceae bacterium]|nr:M48 family metallopeptidase [Nevskiaceae bacterium]